MYVTVLLEAEALQRRRRLVEKGFTQVVNMEGGINAWKKEGKDWKQLQASRNCVMRIIKSLFIQRFSMVDLALSGVFPAEKCSPL